MRKLFVFATFALLLVLPTSTSIQAHPGRTDSNGCHTCPAVFALHHDVPSAFTELHPYPPIFACIPSCRAYSR